MLSSKRIIHLNLLFLVSFAAVALAAWVGWRSNPAYPQREEEALTQFSQSFGGVDFDGKELTPADLQGHALTVVNIWATDCGPCIREMTDLAALAQEYAAQDVQFLGLCGGSLGGKMDAETLAEAQSILNECGVSYRNLFPSDTFRTEYLREYVSSVPSTFFVNADGVCIGRLSGAQDADAWRKTLDSYLEKEA